MAVTINASTSAGLISSADTSGILQLQTASTTAVTVSASQNVGIGTASPTKKLDILSNTSQDGIRISGSANPRLTIIDTTTPVQFDALCTDTEVVLRTDTNHPMVFSTNGTERMRLDTSGNLGLGVIPSAWTTPFSAGLQITNFASLMTTDELSLQLSLNAQYVSGWKYIKSTSTPATNYYQLNGGHFWRTAPSGTAGNAITFTQAMTLNASNNLLLGTTTDTTYRMTLDSGSATSNGLRVQSTGSTGSRISVWADGSSTIGQGPNFYMQSVTGPNAWAATMQMGASSEIIFLQYPNTAWAERMRIDSSGNFLVGTTSTISSAAFTLVGNVANNVAYIRNTNSTPYGLRINYSAVTPNNTDFFFHSASDATAVRFEVRSNGGIANYSANNVNLSDRREKTNFAPATSYLDKICAIPVQTFNYIDQNMEEDDGLTLGVIAQDVQSVAPELVMESNWASKDETPKMRLSIYQTDLQYALMKCIQEQQAIIESLKARLDAANL